VTALLAPPDARAVGASRRLQAVQD
jgi:hypothetical protein